ncbi:MAG: SH3 domain-containing protein, partial [Acidobacteria bacterium]|nr:SH3 domain-containing protein [Acidobacteriota bacterium]
MGARSLVLGSFAIVALGFLASCKSKQDASPVIGQAYVGPATISLRKELSLQSPQVATLKHGDPVDIVQVRRRFVKLQTPSGVEGWVDSRQLLTTGQMSQFRKLTSEAADLPSQGWANIVEPLNIHTEPSRFSPSIYQIPENHSVAVIGHRVTERVPPRSQPSLLPKPPPRKPKTKTREKPAASSRVP